MKGDREKCLQSGMDGYVTKPIRARDLFQAIEQVLQTFAPHLLADRPRAKPLPLPPPRKRASPCRRNST